MTHNLPVFLKTSVIRQLFSFFREKSRNNVFRVLKLIFVKRLIQSILSNHYIHFNLNDLKSLRSKITFREREKGDFLTLNNLGASYPCRLERGQKTETSHTNRI